MCNLEAETLTNDPRSEHISGLGMEYSGVKESELVKTYRCSLPSGYYHGCIGEWKAMELTYDSQIRLLRAFPYTANSKLLSLIWLSGNIFLLSFASCYLHVVM